MHELFSCNFHKEEQSADGYARGTITIADGKWLEETYQCLEIIKEAVETYMGYGAQLSNASAYCCFKKDFYETVYLVSKFYKTHSFGFVAKVRKRRINF